MILAGRAGLDTCHDEARALSGVCTRRVPRCDVQGVNSPQQALHMRPGLKVLLTSGHAKTLLEDDDPPGALLSRPYRKNDLARAVDRRTDGGRYAP